jgi:hypothetical protein
MHGPMQKRVRGQLDELDLTAPSRGHRAREQQIRGRLE